MKKSLIFLSLVIFMSVNVAPVLAKTSKSAREKKTVSRWCNEKSFRKEGRYELYGEEFVKIVGVERKKLGPKKYWTCHWKVNPSPGARLSYEYWWAKKYGKEPNRLLEHHYKLPEGTLADSTYADVWFQKDPVTKQKERCQYFSLSGATYCGLLP